MVSKAATIDLRAADMEALARLIARLDETPILASEDADRMNRQFIREVVARMLDGGGSFGQASGAPAILNQCYDDFQLERRAIADDLGRQVALVSEFIDRWFDFGDFVPPAWPWRVAIILRKAKRKDLERRFLGAFVRHFNGVGYSKLTERAQKAGVHLDLSATSPAYLSSAAPPPPRRKLTTDGLGLADKVTFNCIDCGHPVTIDDHDPPLDDDVLSCRGCGRHFGRYSVIKEAIRKAALAEVEKLNSQGGATA